MKKIIAVLVLLYSFIPVKAQVNADLSSLLNHYYTIKNALVAGDAAKVAVNAAAFTNAISNVDTKSLAADEQKTFSTLQAKLLADAKTISETKDISKQREIFLAFSNNMIALAKATKLSAQPLYVDYCPMKKAYWLSADQPIRNPYYGNSMLTCGSIKDTIK